MTLTLAIVAALATAAGIAARPASRVGSIALAIAAAAWLGGMTQLAADQFGRSLLVPVVALGGVVVAAGIARLVNSRPLWILATLVVGTTARIPIPGADAANDGARLLVVFYAVVAVIGAGFAIAAVRAWAKVPPRSRAAAWADGAGAAWLAWTGATLPLAAATGTGSEQLLLGPIPFALAYAWIRSHWSLGYRTGQTALVALTTIMSAAALVGMCQWLVRDIFWNPKVIAANAVSPIFRVNAWFWDPNIYGRYVALALVAAVLLASTTASVRKRRGWLVAATVLAGGLLASFSLSSFLSLAVAAGAAASILMRRIAALALLAAGVVAVGLLVAPFGPTLGDEPGRRSLAREGIRMTLDAPILGVGYAGFEEAYAERLRDRMQKPGDLRASHTEFVTSAAETGLPGLVAQLAFGIAALLAAVNRVREHRREQAWPPPADAWWGAAAVVLVTVHGVFYAGVADNPLTWIALAIAASASAPTRGDRAQPPNPTIS